MYDIAIIGAGIVGSSIARELSKYNLKIVVLEKGVEVCQGTTKANSAIVHGGYDANEGSLKAKLNVEGNKLYPKLCEELNVEFKQNGSLVLAFDEEDKKHIQQLYDRGIKNGVEGLKILNKEEVLKLEPSVNKNVVSALLCEVAGIVCPFNLNIALMENAITNGVDLKLESEVVDINKIDDEFNINVITPIAIDTSTMFILKKAKLIPTAKASILVATDNTKISFVESSSSDVAANKVSTSFASFLSSINPFIILYPK